MMKIVSSVCAAAMALTLPLSTGAMAMPKAAPSTQSAIVLAQSESPGGDGQSGEYRLPGSRGGGGQWQDRGDRGGQWQGRGDRGNRGDRGWQGNRNEARGDMYWRGHRGYRDHRPGYRRHGDFWFPPAAFIAGAILGGALNAQEPPVRYRPRGNDHVTWCFNRYRSYRASDNTYQPYNGPRRQCQSPYG